MRNKYGSQKDSDQNVNLITKRIDMEKNMALTVVMYSNFLSPLLLLNPHNYRHSLAGAAPALVSSVHQGERPELALSAEG